MFKKCRVNVLNVGILRAIFAEVVVYMLTVHVES